MRKRLERYRECPELAWGTSTVLEHDVGSVLAQRSDWDGGTIVLCHNLADSGRDRPTHACRRGNRTRLVNLFDLDDVAEIKDAGMAEVALEGYGARWFRLLRDEELTLL